MNFDSKQRIGIYRSEPDLEFEGILKRNSTCVEFFQGTMFNSVDLERVKVYDTKMLHLFSKHQELLTVRLSIFHLLMHK